MNNSTDEFKESANGIVFTDLRYAYVFTSVIIFLPTVIGNSLILMALYRFRDLRSPMGILIGNLAVSDFLVGSIVMPLEVAAIFLSRFNDKYPCLITIGISVTLTMSSVLNMLAITFERFISVRYPLKHMSFKTKIVVKSSIPVIWCSVSIIGFLPLMGINNMHCKERCTCAYNEVFLEGYIIFVTSFYALCTLANIGFLATVVKIALKTLRKIRDSNAIQSRARVSRNLARTYLMIMVCTTFIICWGPFTLLTIIGLLYRWKTYHTALKWAYFLGFLNSGINWIIYGLKSPKFRKAIRAFITCKTIPIDPYISQSNDSIAMDGHRHLPYSITQN